MTQTANEVVVGVSGSVYVAPVGTALPTTEATALNVAFVELGFVGEDGVQFTDNKTVEGIKAWQSFYDIRKIITEKEAAVEFMLKQWNKDTVKLAFGGGSLTNVGSGSHSKYQPPSPTGTIDYRAMIIEWTDDTDKFRLVIPRGLITGEVTTNILRTSNADLPLHFDSVPAGFPDPLVDSTQPWYILTNALLLT